MRKRILFLLACFYSINTVQAASRETTVPEVSLTLNKHSRETSTSGPQEIISREHLIESGVTTLTQALQSLGGIQLHDISGNNNQVLLGMRGFGANAGNNTLLLVNGIPMNNPDMAPPNLNLIPVDDIEFINIIFGSESVIYGDQAVGGVIDISTHANTKKAMTLSCNTGSYLQRSCLLSLQNRTLGFNMAANRTDNYREHNRADQQRVRGSIQQSYSRGRLDMNLELSKSDLQYPGALTLAQVRQNRRQAANDTDFFNDENISFQTAIKHELSSRWYLTTDLAAREMSGKGVLTSPFTQYRQLFFIKPASVIALNSVKLTSGGDLQLDQYHLRTAFGTTQDQVKKYGLFSLANFFPCPRLTLSAGIRGALQTSHLSSQSDRTPLNRAAAATLGGTYETARGLTFYLRRADSFRFPNADELASTPPGTSGLKTQRGTAYETGMKKSGEKYTGKLEIYLLTLKDEIMFDPFQTPENPFGTNTNLDPTKRRGLRLSGEYHFNNQLTLDALYQYVNARFQSGIYKGKRIPLVSENLYHAGIHQVFSENWSMYVETIFTGSQYADSDNGNTAGAAGGYTVFNASLRYEYRQFTAALHINNIFNKEYNLYTIYQTMTNTEYFYPAPDRNLVLTVTYTFN